MSRIDRSKIKVRKRGYKFRPFRPTAKHERPLLDANFPLDTELMAFERNGVRRVLLVEEMIYHHVAQGELAGEPYLISF